MPQMPMVQRPLAGASHLRYHGRHPLYEHSITTVSNYRLTPC